MAQQRESRFVSYIFAEGEVFTLSDIQRKWIQTRICEAAELLLNLKYDPLKPEYFLQNQASLQARIDALQELLDDSDHSNFQLNSPEE